MFTHKVGTAWEIQAPAKLNLYLEVLGPRADGFHALETLMVPVQVYDQLSFTPAQSVLTQSAAGQSFRGRGFQGRDDSLSLRVRNLLPESNRSQQLLGEDTDNLILRAARLLAETAGVSPTGRFDLIKRIPIQAGMGGGSSDAAAALLLANDAWELGYSRQQLMPLAAQLGSDVPFFLGAEAAICRGRGELVEQVARLPRLHFVIAKPPAGLATAEVFSQLRERTETVDELAAASDSRLSALVASLRRGALSVAAECMTNRLESAAAQMAPWLVQLREVFLQAGCVGHFLTGSGSAYVGVMRSAKQARCTARRLANLNLGAGLNLGNVFATSSC